MLYMEALMEDKPADYQSLEEILYTYTDGFTKEEGSYPLKDRADRENAAAILKKYYNEVSKNHLDVNRQDDDGTVDYKVYFSDPKFNFEDENSLNESLSKSQEDKLIKLGFKKLVDERDGDYYYLYQFEDGDKIEVAAYGKYYIWYITAEGKIHEEKFFSFEELVDYMNDLNEAKELPSGYEHVFTDGNKLIHRKKPFKTHKGEMIVSSLKKKKKPELFVMPDKNPANIPAGIAAGMGTAMGESLDPESKEVKILMDMGFKPHRESTWYGDEIDDAPISWFKYTFEDGDSIEIDTPNPHKFDYYRLFYHEDYNNMVRRRNETGTTPYENVPATGIRFDKFEDLYKYLTDMNESLREDYHDGVKKVTDLIYKALEVAKQGDFYNCEIERVADDRIEVTDFDDKIEYEVIVKFNLLENIFVVNVKENNRANHYYTNIYDFLNDETYFDVNKLTQVMKELEPFMNKEDLSTTNVQQELMALGFDEDWRHTYDDGTYVEVQEFPNNYDHWWLRYDDGEEIHDQRFRTFKELKDFLGEFNESLREAGPKHSRAYSAALAVAKGFKGMCGAFSNEDPKVFKKGNEAEIIFTSQMPDETYVIHSDLSVDFQFSDDNLDAYEDYGFESRDEAQAFFEDSTYWPSIEDWLNDDENFGWAGGLSSKDINAILKDINSSNNEDLVDFTETKNREENVRAAFSKEISTLERDGFEFVTYIACMQYDYNDGTSMLVAFPGIYRDGIKPWRLIFMKNGNDAGRKEFNTFDELYDFMGDDDQMESLKEAFSSKYNDQEEAILTQLGFELDANHDYESWKYHFDDGAQLDLYKWLSYTYGPGIADIDERWILDYIDENDYVQSTKECKSFDDMIAFIRKMGEQLSEAKKPYVATEAHPAPELIDMGFEPKQGTYYEYKYNEDCSITVYPPGKPDRSNVRNDQHWTFEFLDFSQPEDGHWKVHRNFETYEELLQFIHENMDEALKEKVEKHDELNKDLWDAETKELRPEVKAKIIEVVDKFKENLEQDEVDLDIDDIVIIGSNASYNYTDKSDIDVHIVADVSDYDDYSDLAMKCYQAYKSLFNNKYDPMIRGHEVEIYVEPGHINAKSNGMYSILHGWLKEPVKNDIPEVDQKEVDDLVEPFIERAKQVKTIDDIDELIDDIYVLRQEGILEDGEYSTKNLAFKAFRDSGYLSDLKDKKVELENKEMSL